MAWGRDIGIVEDSDYTRPFPMAYDSPPQLGFDRAFGMAIELTSRMTSGSLNSSCNFNCSKVLPKPDAHRKIPPQQASHSTPKASPASPLPSHAVSKLRYYPHNSVGKHPEDLLRVSIRF
jgi:hypothetical protein